MFLNSKELEYLKNPTFYKGIIEDNNDPMGYGRIRVRVIGVHADDKVAVPTSTLPWANITRSLDFGGLKNGVGISSIPQVGTWVYLFFEFGEYDRPVIIGALGGIDGGEQSLDTDYMTKHTIRTPNNHIIQIDDGNNEMIIQHDNGSQITITPDAINIISVKDRYEFAVGNYNQTVMQTMTINADGSILINSGAKFNLTVQGDTNINTNGNTLVQTVGTTTVKSTGDMAISTEGNLSGTVTGNLNVKANGTGNIESVGAMTLKASQVTIQGGSTMVI